MRLLDANGGIGRPPAKPTEALTIGELITSLAGFGIAGGMVSEVAALLHDPVSANRALAKELEGQASWRPTWQLIPATPGEAADPEQQVAEAIDNGAAAVKIAPETLGFAVADVTGGLIAAAQAGLPLQVDAAELGWSGINAVCASNPDLTVVISRVGYRALRRLAPAFAAHPNLLLDTVDFSTHEGWEWFVSHFGADRLLLATGTPTREAAEAPTRLQWSSLSNADIEKIGWQNAVRVFGLPSPEPREPATNEPTPNEPTPNEPVDRIHISTRDDLATAVAERRPAPVGIIDAHAHMGPYSLFFTPATDPASMVRVMDRTGVATAIVAATRGIQQDAFAGNTETLAAARAHPGRILGYAVVNPWQDPERMIESIADTSEFVGIKVHPSLHEYPLSGPRYRPVWEWAAATGCPVLTHTWYESLYDSPAHAAQIVEAYPGLTMIMGHSGASPAGHDVAADLAVRIPGLYLETCGSFQTGQVLRDTIDRVGADRVLFGSDFPFIDQRIALGRLTFAGLDADRRDAILRGNAQRLFGWRT